MTNEQNARIAVALCGYEVQVSPAGKWYVVTSDETKPMPDFEADWHETMTTMITLCKSRGWVWDISRYKVVVGPCTLFENGMDTLQLVAHCLLQIAEGE